MGAEAARVADSGAAAGEPLAGEVAFERRGHLGVATLNRPAAVNALTAGMAAAMLEQLTLWADDDAVAAVLVRGAGDRGLCAAVTSWPSTGTCSTAGTPPRTSGRSSTG